MEQTIEITGYEAIPDELKKYPNWICYRIEEVLDKEGKPKLDKDDNIKYTKKPYTPTTGFLASTTNSSTWTDFNTAVKCEVGFDGLGFVFTDSPFVGVDLDNIKSEIIAFQEGNENNIVGEFYNQLQTYTEISPSGNGLHFILKGELPQGGNKFGNIEMYETERYFTVTGDQLGNTDTINSNGTELIRPLHKKYFGNDNDIQSSFKDFETIPSYGNGLSEEEVLKALMKDKDSIKWLDLFYKGNWQKYGYQSRSDGELALVSKLGFYSNYDKNIMDSLFKQSALLSEKWERSASPTKIYTIGRIIASKPETGGYRALTQKRVTGALNWDSIISEERKPDDNSKGIQPNKIIDMKQLKQNSRPPQVEDFDEDNSVLPDKNGVLWYLKEFSTKDPEVKLVTKYVNYEKMARLVTNMMFNEFSEVVEYQKDGKLELVDDPYISEMYRNISGLYVDIPQKDLYHIVNNLGREVSYHPIKQLIEFVEWDKQLRIETFFIDYFGLEDTPYHREATRKWFIGAIARIYDPGVKFDMVPIIRGAQGTGKTTAIERLAFDLDYYLSLNGEKANDKDTLQLLRDSWLVELEELEFIRNNTEGATKKFFSSRDDKYREPYGKSQRNYKRHSVFIGTVNNKSFLTDKTGNRRYFPLVIDDAAVGKFNVFNDLTKEVVHQLWAEALVYYKAKESIICSTETERVFDVIRGNVMEEDVTEQTLLEFLDLELPQEYYQATLEQKRLYLSGVGNKDWSTDPQLRPDITTREILTECFGREIDADWRGDQSSKRINSIMENLSEWKKSKNIRRIGVDGKEKIQRGFTRHIGT